MLYQFYMTLVLLVLIPISQVVSKDDKGKVVQRPNSPLSGDTVSREDLALLNRYTGKVELPADLLKAYAQFVRAAKDPKTTVKALEAYCLQGSVEITHAGRPKTGVRHRAESPIPTVGVRRRDLRYHRTSGRVLRDQDRNQSDLLGTDKVRGVDALQHFR